MVGNRTLLVLAVGAFLLVQFADCLNPFVSDQEIAECCGAMPCTPALKSHDCCKTNNTDHTPRALPSAKVSVSPAMLAAVSPVPLIEIIRSAPFSRTPSAAQQHSPPDLYTLHLSLLI